MKINLSNKMKDGVNTVRVYDNAKVTVDAVRVSHEPVEPTPTRLLDLALSWS